MRRGEALALRWGDIDFDASTVAVRRSVGVVHVKGQPERLVEGTTKTGKARVIDLDPTTLAALKAHRAVVAEVSLMLARDDALVLGTLEGQYRHPERFSRRFAETLEAARRELGTNKLPMIRLHDLRHTHATLLLQAGVHPKIVSERLGHAKISITLDVYSHAMAKVSEALAGAPCPLSQGGITDRVRGKRAVDIRTAIARLIDEGYISTSPGPRGAIHHTLVKPFGDSDD